MLNFGLLTAEICWRVWDTLARKRKERKKEERKIEITGQEYNGLPYYIG